MQENLKARRNPILHKIITIVFLPIFIFIWMTGWILIQIEPQAEHAEISQTLRTNTRFEAQNKESKAPDEDSRVTNEPQIIA
ncbi:hypothetical protein MUO98_02190 [Candidatus Bathyarchaeota archaeon]|nr:hypothetical protein [Candidatus Bathyarchaeota archaeon]